MSGRFLRKRLRVRYHSPMNRTNIALFALLGLIFCFAFLIISDRDVRSEGGQADDNLIVATDTTNMNTAIEGLQIDILTPGTGAGAESGQTLIVDYTGMLTDGTIFDSSIPRGQPFPVNLGRGEVIRGWDLGLVGMKVGEKRKLTISSELAYGKEGFSGVIPPNATLVFEITLKAIQ